MIQRGLHAGDIDRHQQPLDVVHPLTVAGERQMTFQPQPFLTSDSPVGRPSPTTTPTRAGCHRGDPDAISINNSASPANPGSADHRPEQADVVDRQATRRPSSRRRSARQPTSRRGGPDRVPNEPTICVSVSEPRFHRRRPRRAPHLDQLAAACTTRAISASNRVATRRRSTTRRSHISRRQQRQISRGTLRQRRLESA